MLTIPLVILKACELLHVILSTAKNLALKARALCAITVRLP
jgi:hypothetical protein